MFFQKAQELAPQIIEWRRDFHKHPEMGFKEFRTASRVSEELGAMGIEHQTGVGITGVVAYIGDTEGPIIAIRGDMDALPIHEINDVPYRSLNNGVMHACGHDAHTAMLLGVANMLSTMSDRPAGQVRLLFQPSEEGQDEEGESGATRMISGGAMKDVDAVIALHVDSQRPAGKIDIMGGYSNASADAWWATIKGKGGHAAYPHRTVDPIYLLAQVINAIHGIRARRLDPMKEAVVTVGTVHGGDATNVIPDEVRLMGTIRTFDPAVRKMVWEELDRAFEVARVLGGDYELRIQEGYPSLFNDHEVAALIRKTAVDLFGPDSLLPNEPGMGAEDFSYMTQLAPGAMFMLGAKLDEVDRPHHNARFDIDEGAFSQGTALLAESAVRLLRNGVKGK
jgi:amidohydrolase